MYICWLKKTKNKKNTEWMSILLSNLHWLKIGIIESDNIIFKPLLTEKKWSLRVTMLLSNLCWLKKSDHWEWQYYCQTSVNWKKRDHWGWQYYCRTSVDWKMGSLRVIILLSNLCWLKMDHWGWQYYCHISWNKIEIAGSTIRLKMWKVYDILMDRHFSIRKAQLSLWFKWAKKVVSILKDLF